LKQDTRVVDAQVFDKIDMVNSTNEPVEMTDAPSRSHEDTSVTIGPQNPLMTDAAKTLKEPPDVRILTVEDEISRPPSAADMWKTAFSLQTLLVALPYLCSFGAELAVEGMISDFYIQTANIQDGIIWNYQTAGNWAAIFGLLNIFTRPLGGYLSDIFYRYQGLTAKKWWLIFLGIMHGVFLIWIGCVKFRIYPLIGVMTGLAIFMDAANGAIFALVPAIHPKLNGVVSGVTGASGNIGGVLFNLVFRFFGTDYHTTLWIIGIFCLGSNIAVTCIPIRAAIK
jgi:NNP family nitrate/nitrite transporter-like MFS transporter